MPGSSTAPRRVACTLSGNFSNAIVKEFIRSIG
jgi:hypothetical protein